MKRQLVGFLGFLILLFCVSVVIWQLYQGTKKYLDTPVASKIYTQEVEVPVITICHANDDMKIVKKYGLDFSDFVVLGKFLPDDPVNMTAEEVLNEATDHFYYLLDYTGCATTIVLDL